MNDSSSILIVEDDSTMRHLIRDTLAAEGIAAQMSEDSRAAANLIEQSRVDIVLTDLMMPHLDGMEILARARHHNPDCVVIVITGYGTIESAVEAIRKGAYDYVQKPFEPDALVLAVQRAMEHARLVRENKSLREQAGERRERHEPAGSSILAVHGFTSG